MSGATKITIELDADEVAQLREAVGARPDQSDDVIVARVINGFLLKRLISRVQRRFNLSE